MADPTIGEIPDHWTFTTLGELCKADGGSIQTGPFGSQLHASDYVPVGIPSIMPVNIGDNRLVEEGIARITEADAERLSKHRVKAGDIIYSRRGDVERRALVREHEEGWLCGTGCLKVRFGAGAVDSRYASYYLGHPSVRQWIVRHAVGATMPNLNTGIMEAIPFAFPPLPEQEAIAHILGTLDDKIELNRRMNETLETMARALFKSWFVDFDPVRAMMDGRQPPGMDADTAALFPDSFEHLRNGELVPNGWRIAPLHELSRDGEEGIIGGPFGSNMTRRHYVESGVPVIRGNNMESRDGWFNDSGFVFVSKEKSEDLSRNLAGPGDVLFTQRGTLGQVSLIPQDCEYPKYVISQSQMRMTCADWVPPEYVFLLFREPATINYIIGNATSSGVPHINLTFLRQFPALLPPRDVLKRFGQVVRVLHKQIVANANIIRTLIDLRDAVLPKLLAGEIRVCAAPDHV